MGYITANSTMNTNINRNIYNTDLIPSRIQNRDLDIMKKCYVSIILSQSNFELTHPVSCMSASCIEIKN